MELKNGYKVIYDVAKDGERSFYASAAGKFEGADLIATAKIGEFKLIYEKGGRIYGSASGIPAEGDHCFEAFDAVFVEAEDEEETPAPAAEPAPAAVEPEVATEPEDEEPDAGEAVENPDEE